MEYRKHPSLPKKAELDRLFPGVFCARAQGGHKGTFGSLGVLGGSPGMMGAIVLVGEAALKMGCGRVFLSFAGASSPPPFISSAPELMIRASKDLLARGDELAALVIGCGLGTSKASVLLLENALTAYSGPMVLDADALNILARHGITVHLAPERQVMTPHAEEAARLLKIPVAAVNQDREQAAREIAKQYQVTVVLKGPGTIVYTPESDEIYVNTTGNVGLATAGSGDVLSGILGSLLAQGFPLPVASRAAVFLHGLAADLLVQNGIGPIGLTASEIAPAARYLRNYLTTSS